MRVQGFWKIFAPLCFTPRHVKEGVHFTFRHVFLASCWVGACYSAVNLGLYSCSRLNMSLQNVRGSVIAARSLTTPFLFLGGGGLKAVCPWLGWHLLFQHVVYRGEAEITFEKVLHGISPCTRVVRSWLSFIWSQNYPRFRGNPLIGLYFWAIWIQSAPIFLSVPAVCSCWVRAVLLNIANETIAPGMTKSAS